MAKCRMISKEVVEDIEYLSLTAPAQVLYIFLCLNADDEGFVPCTKRVIKQLGLSARARNALVERGFLIYFEESDVTLIRHWHRHNKILRPKRTYCLREKSAVCLVDNCYRLCTEVVDNL